MPRHENKDLADKMMVPQYTPEDVELQTKAAEENNIPAMLSLILHNQRIVNDKLNMLLTKRK